MVDERTETLILRDQHGDYYVLTREVLERAQVPAERRGEVEQLVAAVDDTAGFTTTSPVAPPTLGSQAQLLGFSFGLTAQALFTPTVPIFTPPPEDQAPPG